MSPRLLFLIYLGVGCLISSVAMWQNWLSLRDDAHIAIIVIDALTLAVSWGLWAGLFIVLAPFAWLIDRWPMKNIDDWTNAQYDRD